MTKGLEEQAVRNWSLFYFFIVGAILGAVAGFVVGWLDYGRPDIRFMYNHILGLALIGGVAAMAVAALRNWMMRNPMA